MPGSFGYGIVVTTTQSDPAKSGSAIVAAAIQRRGPSRKGRLDGDHAGEREHDRAGEPGGGVEDVGRRRRLFLVGPGGELRRSPHS